MSAFALMRAAAAAVVLIAGAVFAGQPAGAATVIYYSGPENVYGWCAGYASGRAHRCAQTNCAKYGGSSCQPAVECRSGWGAVAFAERPARGFGASCLGDAFSARRGALIACISASNALCWTDVTFSPNAKISPARDNREFDRVWFAQLLLQLRRLYDGTADGTPSAQTGAAIGAFQARLGRPGTGIVDDELLRRLLDANSGPRDLAGIVKRDLLSFLEKQLSEAGAVARMFSSATAPARQMSFSQDLMARTAEDRLLALATFLAVRNTKCTLPARDAHLIGDDSSGMWFIACDEGAYQLILSSGSSLIVKGSSPKKAE